MRSAAAGVQRRARTSGHVRDGARVDAGVACERVAVNARFAAAAAAGDHAAVHSAMRRR